MTGKIERFHQSLRRELLDDHPPFVDLTAAQTAIDTWRTDYNTLRPHQSLDMATPASRFRPAPADGLPLRLPAGLVPVEDGRRVTLRLDGPPLHLLVDGVLTRTMPAPIPAEQRYRIRDARLAGPMPARPVDRAGAGAAEGVLPRRHPGLTEEVTRHRAYGTMNRNTI